MDEVYAGQVLVKTFPSVAAKLVAESTQAMAPGQEFVPGGKLINRIGPSGWTLWEIPSMVTPAYMAKQMMKKPGVLAAQPVNRIYPLLVTPNDPDWNFEETSETYILSFGEDTPTFRRLWNITDTAAFEGWQQWPNRWYTSANKPASAPTVAVIDTGLDMNHPDFMNAGGSTTDVSGGGQLVHSMSQQFTQGAITPGGTPMDSNGHGTHVAGLAIAAGNNGGHLGKGMIGTGYVGKGMALRVFDSTGNGSDSDAAAAMFYAADQGADIINLSLGTRNFSQLFQDAVTYAWQKGTLVVCAANESGNGGGDIGPIYPAACSGALAVTANGPDLGSAASTYAGTGSYVDLAAPGGDVIQSTDYFILQYPYSTAPTYFVALNGEGVTFPPFEMNYTYLLGTSMACPQVSGAATLFYDKYDVRQGTGWANVRAYQALERSAFSVAGAPNGGWEPVQGYGNLDMMALADHTDTNPRGATVGSIEGVVYYNATAISGSTVNAQAVSGGTIYNTTTQAGGAYRFDQLPSSDANPIVYKVWTSPFGILRTKYTPVTVGSDVTGFDFWSNGVIVDENNNVIVFNADNTPPVIQRFGITSVRDNVMTVDHFGYDENTGLRKITVQIGTSSGTANVMAAQEIYPTTNIAKVTIPPLTLGATYWVTATYTNNDGDVSTRILRYTHRIPEYDAVVEGYTVSPVYALPGQNININVTVRNKGSKSWGNAKSSDVLLAAADPKPTEGWAPAPMALPSGVTIKPGRTYTFTMSRPAPSTTGAWRLSWRLRSAATGARSVFFGDASPTSFINVD